MHIQCTKSLLDKIGIGKDELASPEGHEAFPQSFMAWHANFVTINRKKAIVLMNNETRYPVVIYRPLKKDFKKIKKLISEAISEAFRMEGIRQDVIDAYMVAAGDISFSKTANRSIVAKLNNTVREVEFMGEYLDEQSLIQKYISIVSGRFLQLDGSERGFYPIEKTYECLGNVANSKEVLDISLYQLNIQINIPGYDIWRRVLVPSTFSFEHLHNIIQSVFDWQNYHLHEFTMERTNKKPLKIVMDDDPDILGYFNFELFDMAKERFVALEEIFLEQNEIHYEYDFGDSWVHTITLEEIVHGTDFRATYLEGDGERPPEDVGGISGYEEYRRVMADGNDPEYESMKMWSEGLKEREISAKKMNKRLGQVLKGFTYSPHF